MMIQVVRLMVVVATVAVAARSQLQADEPSPGGDLFRRDNLIAWCIVPFDAKKRGPEERAEMLSRLGFKHFAYDYRAEHIPTFDAEIAACKKHGIALDAWWYPRSFNDDARHILEVCRRNDIRPQLWVTGGGDATMNADEQRRRVEEEAGRIRPIAEAAAAQGMKVGLYNHGGWFGQPENQLAIIEALQLSNVGIVYNLHHGHEHLDRFATLLPKMLPHLLALNLNGMETDGDRHGRKILQLGQGARDLELLRLIRASGYRGPIGILGHTQDDAELRLQDNLDGLDWLLPQLDGKEAGPKPKPRTPVPAEKSPTSSIPAATAGWLVAGRAEYRTPPLAVECRAMLTRRDGYNILVACDTKQSAAHWELFTMPNTGLLTAYLPGYEPDHIRTAVDAADGKRHDVAMQWEADRVRLFVDGKLAADQAVKSQGKAIAPGDFGLGRLVEGTLSHGGKIDAVRLSRGVREIPSEPTSEFVVDAATIGLWNLNDDKAAEIPDESSLKNPGKRAVVAATQNARNRASDPPLGVHLKPVDPKLRAKLLARSSSDVYLGVKVDSDRNVFVGGRESLFLFERDRDGSLLPRRELLRFPPDAIIMGLEFRGDDLYVLTDNALYLVPQGRVRRQGLEPKRILWGLPLDLHVSFHCLAWGPDGLLYLTHGDPLLQFGDWSRPDHWGHWTLFCGRENRPLPYTGQGAVLRMKPDGSNVEVVARGLRGPVGLAFDRDGNLFTNDNDHESKADQYAPSRLLHVVPGIDFGWPRGWAASKSPDRADLIEPMCDLGRGVPCDLMFYDRPLLADVLGERLLMCRWDRHSVTAYRPLRSGATFTAVEETIAVGDENCRPVGIAADRDGRLYVTALYMTGNQAAPDCVSDLLMIERVDDSSGPLAKPIAVPKKVVPNAEPLNDARSEDLYRRQLGVSEMARTFAVDELRQLAESPDAKTRLAAVLALGKKLTVPEAQFVPPTELELSYPKGSSFFHRRQRFYGEADSIDLADLGRIGSFTIAQLWRQVPHAPDQEMIFGLLVAALNDTDDRVRSQSAYFLSLLNDSRSEPGVAATRRDLQLRKLQAASEFAVERAWLVGPFSSSDTKGPFPGSDSGLVDLAAVYGGRAWHEVHLAKLRPKIAATGDVNYLYFHIVSGSRQAGLLTLTGASTAELRHNDAAVAALADGVTRWIVDLQPGTNDFLLRVVAAKTVDLRLQAAAKLEVRLPEKVDSNQLTERLRTASIAESGQTVAAEFLGVDWARAAADGDAVEGRRLFGVLGCAKCHAVVADQKSAGAPSLFEARRRFTVPHLVESVLLPSRLVAEPFRAQTFVTDDGRTLTGLVTGESPESVELLLSDARRATLAKKQIEDRATTQLSPMPQGLVKTPTELRHLLAYLLSDHPLPP